MPIHESLPDFGAPLRQYGFTEGVGTALGAAMDDLLGQMSRKGLTRHRAIPSASDPIPCGNGETEFEHRLAHERIDESRVAVPFVAVEMLLNSQ
jgi:hypothetical protein